MENPEPRQGARSASEGALAIRAEIARRWPSVDHPLGRYQVVLSGCDRLIRIASATGLVMDVRYTPLEIYAEYTLTWESYDPDEARREVGWRISTPAEIVDLLVDVTGKT